MMKWLIRRRLAAFEAKFGYDVGYARDILDADTRALIVFFRLQGMSNYRRDLPRDPYWCAKLVGTVSEDCGPCSQLVVTMGLAAGADPKQLAAVLARDDGALPDDTRLVVRFARLSLAHSPDADELRDQIVARWGRLALVSVAFALASARVYPTVKYALGHGRACQRVVVDGKPVAVAAAREAAA